MRQRIQLRIMLTGILLGILQLIIRIYQLAPGDTLMYGQLGDFAFYLAWFSAIGAVGTANTRPLRFGLLTVGTLNLFIHLAAECHKQTPSEYATSSHTY